MGLLAKKTGGADYEPVSQGMHQAVCYSLVDLGTHFNETFGKTNHKILIGWEIPNERIDVERDGAKVNLPRSISARYTLSLSDKATLRKVLESWRGKPFTEAELDGFDLTKLLGANCMIQVMHQKKGDKTYANVTTVVPLYKGMPKLEPENPIQYFAIEEHQCNIPESLPGWIKDIIKSSEEWHIMAGDAGGSYAGYVDENPPPPSDDGIPF